MADVPEKEVAESAPDGAAVLRDLCERYSSQDGELILVDVPEREQLALGRFVIQVVFGIFLGVHPLNVSTGERTSAPTVKSRKREAIPAPQ